MKLMQYDISLDTESERTLLVPIKSFELDEWKLSCPGKVAKAIQTMSDTEHLADEFVFVMALNLACKPIGVFVLSRGGVANALCSSRGVFVRALLLGASGIVVLHNHTTGDLKASNEDKNIINVLKKAGEILDIHLLDFIILGRSGAYYSASENKSLV